MLGSLLFSLLLSARLTSLNPLDFENSNKGVFPTFSPQGPTLSVSSDVASGEPSLEYSTVDIILFSSESLSPSNSISLLPGMDFHYEFFLSSDLFNIRNIDLWIYDLESEAQYSLSIDSNFAEVLNEGIHVYSSTTPLQSCFECILHLQFDGDTPQGDTQTEVFSSYVRLASNALQHGTIVGNGLGGSDVLPDPKEFGAAPQQGFESGYTTGGCSLAAKPGPTSIFPILILFFVLFLRRSFSRI